MIRSIFVSRNSTELPLLTEFCEQHAINLLAHSLIYFEAVSNPYLEVPEVIFFSSIRAAEFYLDQHKLSPKTHIATIGAQTAEKLRRKGINVDFVGSTAGDPDKVAQEFAEWLNERKVLIPCSDRSNRSIATTLPADQVKELIVYKTIANSLQISPCDLYIFSSPSNFESFLIKNILPKNGLTIAWGKTTEKSLNEHGIKSELVLSTSAEEEIINYLKAKK